MAHIRDPGGIKGRQIQAGQAVAGGKQAAHVFYSGGVHCVIEIDLLQIYKAGEQAGGILV